MTQQLAPGLRVEIRDAEWRIRRVDYSSDGGYVLTCEGLSELVRGREALFLSKLEDVHVLDSKATELVDDTSSHFGASLLYMDSQLRKTAPSDERLHLGHRRPLTTCPSNASQHYRPCANPGNGYSSPMPWVWARLSRPAS